MRVALPLESKHDEQLRLSFPQIFQGRCDLGLNSIMTSNINHHSEQTFEEDQLYNMYPYNRQGSNDDENGLRSSHEEDSPQTYQAGFDANRLNQSNQLDEQTTNPIPSTGSYTQQWAHHTGPSEWTYPRYDHSIANSWNAFSAYRTALPSQGFNHSSFQTGNMQPTHRPGFHPVSDADMSYLGSNTTMMTLPTSTYGPSYHGEAAHSLHAQHSLPHPSAMLSSQQPSHPQLPDLQTSQPSQHMEQPSAISPFDTSGSRFQNLATDPSPNSASDPWSASTVPQSQRSSGAGITPITPHTPVTPADEPSRKPSDQREKSNVSNSPVETRDARNSRTSYGSQASLASDSTSAPRQRRGASVISRMTEEEKRELNLLRNREAAAKCRGKKKERDLQTEETRRVMSQHNQSLRVELEVLRAEYLRLKTVVLEHMAGHCTEKEALQQYAMEQAALRPPTAPVEAMLRDPTEDVPGLEALKSKLRQGSEGRWRSDGMRRASEEGEEEEEDAGEDEDEGVDAKPQSEGKDKAEEEEEEEEEDQGRERKRTRMSLTTMINKPVVSL